MIKSLQDFTGLFKLPETLSFELKPVGKTKEFVENGDFFKNDFTRAEQYPAMKKILDEEHKNLIDRVLGNIPAAIQNLSDKTKEKYKDILNEEQTAIQWSVLSQAIGRDDDSISDLQKKFREMIAELLKTDDSFADLTEATPSKYLKQMNQEQKNDALKQFDGFATYFKGFQENRMNIYSSEEQSTAISFRAVNDNFSTFFQSLKIFRYIESAYPEIIQSTETELSAVLHGQKLSDIFQPEYYSNILSQENITLFNRILGGYTEQNAKIRGLNEFINLHKQKHDEAKADRKLVPLKLLYKQILSDRESLSFIPEMYQDDKAMLDSVRFFMQNNLREHEINGSLCNVPNEIKNLFDTISKDSNLYVKADELPNISIALFGSWNVIENALNNYADEYFSSKKDRESFLKKKQYSFAELNKLSLVISAADGSEITHTVSDYWTNPYTAPIFSALNEKQIAMEKLLDEEDFSKPLREQPEKVEVIKDYLDSVQNLLHYMKPLKSENITDLDMVFYGLFDPLYDAVLPVIYLYNKVRNYLTKKAEDTKKIKLMFDKGTLADGWDLSKEQQNNSILFLKDGMYYLGIINAGLKAKDKIDFTKCDGSPDEPCYQKMVYKLLPGPNKMLPKVFFSAKGLPFYKPSDDLLEKYKRGDHKKTESTFDLNFCHELIDFFKVSISKNPDWKVFPFRFTDTSEYRGIDEFYKEVAEQGYCISFQNIPESDMKKWVDSGKLYLFQIYNKDFAPGAKGTPNKFTLYWKSLFEPENLKDVVMKLNGEAELFLREPSVKNPYPHRAGEKLVNRITKSGKPIPENVFGEIFHSVNHKPNPKKITPEEKQLAKQLLDSGEVIVKTATHDIIKDRRYTERKLLFHVPITLNFKAPDSAAGMNLNVLKFLQNNPDVNVIGIDRGERNLIYVSVINQKGEILKSKSFNIVESKRFDGTTAKTNYHAKLDEREKERDAARKSWQSIGNIKELKAGYLSAVVHEIARLMVEYNAIVVLEDLNFGFKRGRFAIEKQVYQKFEKALIDKLNYLVFKNIQDHKAAGGVLNGYQLTNKFESFKAMGKQSGFLFYVQAAYTSKIDPSTGFANLFDLSKITNAETEKAFFEKFDDIHYDAQRNAFLFTFDYKNFRKQEDGCGFKTNWTVFACGKRLYYDRKTKTAKEEFPENIIRQALEKRDVSVSNGFDLLSFLKGMDASKANAGFFSSLFFAFRLALQMRNSCAKSDEDYILSPVMNKDGKFFDSREAGPSMPQDADANGAYHIALKGLMLIQRLADANLDVKSLKKQNVEMQISDKDWFEFAQKRFS